MSVAAVPEASDLLRVILRHKGALVALTEAYFDASGTHDGAKDLCLAGYIFRADAALAFDKDWRRMLAKHKLPYFHMKECAHATGVFEHLGHGGSDIAAREAIGLIKDHASQGIAFTVDKSVGAALRKGSMWKNEYSFIVGQVFYAIRDWAMADETKSPVACLFENGDKGRGQALEAAQEILKVDSFKAACRITSFAWADQNEEAHLQAADMLAWHINYWRVKRRQRIIKKRGDFKSLLELKTIYHHWDRAAVEKLASMRRSSSGEWS